MTAGTDGARIAGLVTGAEGGRIAAFLRDGATGFALNPFPATTAGAARHTWAGQAFEFPLLGIEAVGLDCPPTGSAGKATRGAEVKPALTLNPDHPMGTCQETLVESTWVVLPDDK